MGVARKTAIGYCSNGVSCRCAHVGMKACNLQTVHDGHDSEVTGQQLMCMDGACEVLGVVVGWWLCLQVHVCSGHHGGFVCSVE